MKIRRSITSYHAAPRRAVAGVLAALLLTACGGPDPTPTAPAGGAPAATAVLTAAPSTPVPPVANTAVAGATTGAATTATSAATTVAPPGGMGGGGGTLRWSNEGVSELDTLDPPKTQSSNSVMAAALIYEGLVRLDAKLNVQPAGAESWDISPDGKTYTFHIRKGLKWADGSAVTAEDFRYSLERALSKEFANGSAGYYLSNIAGATEWTAGTATGLTGVTTDGADKLVITIAKAGVYFLDQLTYIGGAVVPKKIIDQYGDKWSDHAQGTGPFMAQEWKHNQALMLVPNPNYWRGPLRLDGITMPFVQDPATALQLYQTNQLDIMGAQQFPPGEAANMGGTPGFQQVPQFFDAYIGFNNKQPPLDNVHLRRALALAVDKKTLAEKVLAGAAVPTDHIVPPGMPGYFADLKPLGFDTGAAKAELAQAGQVGKISLSFTTGQADFDKVAATVQQMWKQNLGLDVTLNGEEQGKFNDDLTAMANDPAQSTLGMYISVWGADYPDPQNFLTQQLHSDVGNNNGHWSDPDFDKLTDQADVERDQSRRMGLYNQAEQIAIDKVGWLPLYNGKGVILIRPTVQGLTFTAQGLFADDWTQVTNK
ncbi:MAG TPA: peptide ABC transporter substrate-binding protein [Chloroflexia bacterium]|nr:peptide ABC transporter substrate-binding protein [Chloroflexia bacterium]